MVSTIDTHRDTIVLIHGIAAKRLAMWPLAYRLRAAGFAVRPWSYASLFQSIDAHACRLHEFLSVELADVERVHIVAHSMGAIVARAALNQGSLPNLGRVVLLAPPNSGSPLARLTSTVLGSILPPTRELSDRPLSYVNQLHANSTLEVGVIAARYDLFVPARNTHLVGQRDHQRVMASHNSLLASRKVAQKTVNFLRNGRFELIKLAGSE